MSRAGVRRAMFVASIAVTAACGVYFRAHPGVMYVRLAPPAPYGETMIASPGHGYVWVPGRWEWDTGSYVWIGGAWMLPPPGYGVWEPGRWQHDYHGWFWIRGRWR
jgi:hypothetical protein